VRTRTITGGLGLAVVLLLGLALIGGAADPPAAGPERLVPDHDGPLTAVQPQLDRALLTGDELPRTAAAPAGPEPPGPSLVPAPPGQPSGPGGGGRDERCRALLADPGGLPGLWHTAPPEEVTARQTDRGGGAILHQVLGVFDPEQTPQAYARLRETASSCDRLPMTLSDGTPVTVLLRELARRPAAGAGPGPGPRAESATVPSGRDSYVVALIIESAEGVWTGWLALDRVGPVISVLRRLGPLTGAGPPAGAPPVTVPPAGAPPVTALPGTVPPQAIPSGTVPPQAIPSGTVPPQAIPSGGISAGAIPAGTGSPAPASPASGSPAAGSPLAALADDLAALADDLVRTRRAALAKLWPLLEALRAAGAGAG
jgi:hypothetical protein